MLIAEDIYPSRKSPNPMVIERKDPVIYSDGPLPNGLTKNEVDNYKKNGFLFVPELFSKAEVEKFKQQLLRLTSSEEIRGLEQTITERDSDEVRSIFSVHQLSEFFSCLSRDERILNIVEYILNDEVYLHQSRINFKPGFSGKEFYWHSDFETWHVEDGMPRMRALSVSIALTDNNEFNGPLMLIPGSHMKFVSSTGRTPNHHYETSLKKQEYGVPDKKNLTKMVQQSGIVSPKGLSGSVVFFDCNTMHGSNGNISPYPRSNVFFVYNSLENRLLDPYCGLKPRPEYIACRDSIEPLIVKRHRYIS